MKKIIFYVFFILAIMSSIFILSIATKYGDAYKFILIYYRSMGNKDLSVFYEIICNSLWIIIAFPAVVFTISHILYHKAHTEDKVMEYPYLSHQFQNIINLQIISVLIYFDAYLILMHIPFNNYTIAISNFVIYILILILTNRAKQKYKKIKENLSLKDIDHEVKAFISQPHEPYRRTPFIYALILITGLFMGFTSYEFISHKDHLELPKEIIITPQTAYELDFPDWKMCRTNNGLSCFYPKELKSYYVTDIEIVLSNDSYSKLKDQTYLLMIDGKYYITQEDMNLYVKNNTYYYHIKLKEYLYKNNLPQTEYRGIDIEFVNESKEKIDINNFESFRIILERK